MPTGQPTPTPTPTAGSPSASGSGTPTPTPAPTPAAPLLGGAPTPTPTPTPDPKQGEPAKPPEPAADLEIKLPDGLKADDALISEFKPIAKELGLKQDGAQKLVDLYAKAQTATAQKLQADFTAQQEAWAKQVTNDPQLGGANLNATLAAANKAVGHFGGPELHKALVDLGVANHPLLVKAFAAAGALLNEDNIKGGGGGNAGGAKKIETYEDLGKALGY